MFTWHRLQVNNGQEGFRKGVTMWLYLEVTENHIPADRAVGGQGYMWIPFSVPVVRWVTLGQRLNSSDPQFPHMKAELRNPPSWAVVGVTRRGYGKLSAWCLQCSRCLDMWLLTGVGCKDNFLSGWEWQCGALAFSPHLSHC